MVEAACYVLGVGGMDRFGHVKDAWLPVVLPPRLSPEQALVSDPE